MNNDEKTTKIRFEHISKNYDANLILKDITLDIYAGEFVTIMGPSGCGKTTLLKMINLQHEPSSGNIFIDGQDILTFDPIHLRRRIGYAIQGAVLFPNMTVLENIRFVPSLLSKKEREALHLDIDECLEKSLSTVRLDPSLVDRYPDELSGGQQQRVSIARALAANPDILLMDEPFSAVDEITRAELQSEIKRIQRETNITFLFVTHDVKEALLLGDRVLILNKGEIAQFDTPDEISQRPANAYVAKLLGIETSVGESI